MTASPGAFGRSDNLNSNTTSTTSATTTTGTTCTTATVSTTTIAGTMLHAPIDALLLILAALALPARFHGHPRVAVGTTAFAFGLPFQDLDLAVYTALVAKMVQA